MATTAPADLLGRVQTLRAEVGQHKRAIRHHREQLGDVKARLVALEAECHRLGIGFAVVNGHAD